MRSLILDDDIIFHAVAQASLASLGIMDVRATADAIEASDVLHNEPIDLILLDLNMPNCDGLAFLRSLSEFGYAGAIIIVSGEKQNILSSSAHIGEKLGLNICGTLAKPLKIEGLKRVLECAKTFAAEIATNKSAVHLVASSKLKPTLWYQPQVDTVTGQLVGAEALLRGIDSENSVFGPQDVLKDYRDIESRLDFTIELFELFCADVADMRKAGFTNRFAFNVDATVLEASGFAEACTQTITRFGLDPNLIVIELIESYLPQDEALLLEIIARLSMAGFEVAMDDFSSGASSFDLLRAGAFAEIKLDLELIKSSANHAASAKFLTSAVSVAETLNTRIIAEGIETEKDLARISAMGVREMQGFYFAKAADKSRLKRNYKINTTKLSVAS